MNWLETLRHMDYYGREGLLWNEILWSFGGFVFYIVFWMGSAAAGRWLKARVARKTEPTK